MPDKEAQDRWFEEACYGSGVAHRGGAAQRETTFDAEVSLVGTSTDLIFFARNCGRITNDKNSSACSEMNEANIYG
jgi:hypothetical protein